MPLKLACTCGRVVRVGDHLAGRRVRCPSCSASIDVPPLEVPVPGTGEGSPDPDASVAFPAIVHVEPIASRPAPPPRDPWYCIYLVVVSGIGILGAALLFVKSLADYIHTINEANARGVKVLAIAEAMTVVASAWVLLMALFCAGFVFLAVEAARNLRLMKWKMVDR